MTTKKVWLPDRHTDGRTDRQTPDKVIAMCRYASHATQYCWFRQIWIANLKRRKCQYMKTLTNGFISLKQDTKRDKSTFCNYFIEKFMYQDLDCCAAIKPVSNWGCPAKQGKKRLSLFADQFQKHKLGRGPWIFASLQFSSNSVGGGGGSKEKSKMSQAIRSQGSHLCFLIGTKVTNL